MQLHLLVSQGEGVNQAIKEKAGSLRWHPAIRLYGQRLLERAAGEPRAWRAAMASFGGKDEGELLVRDLLLESVFLAANCGLLLDLLWEDLRRDGGELLDRMLRRFMYLATIPDPRIKDFAEDEKDAISYAAWMRVPYWPFWGPILEYLDRHREELPEAVHETVAEICALWLEFTGEELRPGRPWPWRRDAAQVALKIAREVQGRKAEGVYSRDREGEKPYRAFLLAAPDFPDQVSQLALELCRRRDESPEIIHRRETARKQRQLAAAELRRQNTERAKQLGRPGLTVPPTWRTDRPPRPPWSDGPRSDVDKGFQRVCLVHASMERLIRTRPETAAEVLLAGMIEAPKPDAPLRDIDLSWNNLGTESLHDLVPPLYFRGPFLQFLRLCPEVGLGVVIKVVNFATSRWVELAMAKARMYPNAAAGDADVMDRIRVGLCGEKLAGNAFVYG